MKNILLTIAMLFFASQAFGVFGAGKTMKKAEESIDDIFDKYFKPTPEMEARHKDLIKWCEVTFKGKVKCKEADYHKLEQLFQLMHKKTFEKK